MAVGLFLERALCCKLNSTYLNPALRNISGSGLCTGPMNARSNWADLFSGPLQRNPDSLAAAFGGSDRKEKNGGSEETGWEE